MNSDPRDVIAQSPMSRLQIVVVGITIALNALDGFDILSISFASPGIATEWGIDRAALGIVLSMELIGMAIGSIVLGGVADKIGRRPTILGCLAVMAFGMLMATTVTGLVDLSIWRVVTGLGIGGMLAAINAVAAEFSNTKRRHLSVSLMSIGYPVGAVTRRHRGSAAPAGQRLALGLLFRRGRHGRIDSDHVLRDARVGPLARAQATRRVRSKRSIEPWPAWDIRRRRRCQRSPPTCDSARSADIFGPGLIGVTAIVTLAYFFHITTFYFILKWVPKIVADFGFAASSAAGVLVWTNVGGALGGTVLGFLTLRFGVKGLTIVVMVLSTVMVALFGRTPPDLQRLSMICAAAGFCTNAAIVGMYTIIAQAFPTHVRASGTGFAIGVGRGGSVLAPIIAGFLFTAGYTLPTVALMMSIGSLVAAGILSFLKLETDRTVPARPERRMTGTPVPATGGRS